MGSASIITQIPQKEREGAQAAPTCLNCSCFLFLGTHRAGDAFSQDSLITDTTAAPGTRMALAKACAKGKHLESHPYGLFLVQVTAARAIFPLSVSFCRSWEQGKDSPAGWASGQSRTVTKGQRGHVLVFPESCDRRRRTT